MNTDIIRMKSFSELALLNQLLREGDVIAIAGVRDESYVFENGQPRRVRACVLPDGYFSKPQQLDVPDTVSGSQPTVVRVNATAQRAAAEGYASEAQMGNSELAAKLREEKLEADARRFLLRQQKARQKREAKTKVRHRLQKQFEYTDLYELPQQALTPDEKEAIFHAMRNVFWDAVALCDYHPSLAIAALKEADDMIRAAEKQRYNCIEAGEAEKRKIAMYRRASTNGEIDGEQIRQAEERLHGLRWQAWHFSQKIHVYLEERETLVLKIGIRWPAYRPQAHRYALSPDQYRSEKRRQEAQLAGLKGKSELEYRNWLRDREEYVPSRDGIQGAGASETTPSTDAEAAKVARLEEPDTDVSYRPVHRQRLTPTAHLDGSPA